MPRRHSEDVIGRANGVEPVPQPPPAADPGKILQLKVEEPAPGVRVIRVAGELDVLSAPTLEDSVHPQLACGSHGLIIDLTELSFLGCAGILVLLRAREAAQRKKVPLQLVCNSAAVLRILKISDVLDRFALSPTLDDALGRAT